MSSGARVFAIQTHKIANLFGVGGGGVPELDPATAAGLCQGMRREWYLAGRLKWALDWSVANELEYLLWIDGTDIAKSGRWKIPKGREYVRKMAGLAIAELADPHKWKHDYKRAEWMGVSPSQFSRIWVKRYNEIYSLLDDWSNSAYSYVMIKQRYSDQ